MSWSINPAYCIYMIRHHCKKSRENETFPAKLRKCPKCGEEIPTCLFYLTLAEERFVSVNSTIQDYTHMDVEICGS